ncbi:NAD-dependent epimerase/dehydratase family protein [Paracoccus beibuensis]|uniref:NAD-dependent epimerase/dehydratase family protein n=1 Tax=Paracoccus beibuensis TaxID=547602 RepID=UPI00223F86FD|nr:NAD-dependent epimerase/dehydratase family protein [Paracoccus beibuensis]
MSADYGFVEWFRPGEYDRVEALLPALVASGARHLRTHVSWAEYHSPGGQEWFDWLLPRLARDIELLPCVHYTPPSLSRTGRSSGAPKVLKDYADFIDMLLTRHGQHFTHVELWNEPNNLLDWDWREDPDFDLFCEMVGGAAHWVQHRGWKAVLGGPAPFDPYWLNLMGERGVLGVVDVVGFHGFPGTWDSEAASWRGWDMHLGEMRRIMDLHNPDARIWITETGYSTWRRDEIEQARRFVQSLQTPADRVYWYAWADLPADVAVQEGLWFDPRHYHMGAATADGQLKLLGRLLTEGGVGRLQELTQLASPTVARTRDSVLITGGAGFIGANLADALMRDGQQVTVLDNLSRPGVERNLRWLADRHGDRLRAVPADLRDQPSLGGIVDGASAVFHLAAQTAVTTSLASPLEDFEVNARGTLNLLEAVRATGRQVPVIFASTNKVYGALSDLTVTDSGDRCGPLDNSMAAHGVAEDRPLDFCTPYGCSKGVADQYVLDYAKSYGIPAAVLRMSCIYGPRQFGTEDQGWVAHFLIRALEGRPITVFGTGRQVRDVLHVSDAVAAYRTLLDRIDSLSGHAFNLGGGPSNAVSLREVLSEIAMITGEVADVSFEDWRQGDQPWFVADTRALQAATGWKPRVDWRDGLADLAQWLAHDRGLPLRRERRSA